MHYRNLTKSESFCIGLNNKLLWLTSWCTMSMLLLGLEKEGFLLLLFFRVDKVIHPENVQSDLCEIWQIVLAGFS